MFSAAGRLAQLLPGQVELPESYDQPTRSDKSKGKPEVKIDGSVPHKACADEKETLRSALLDAGVSPELVSQVLASYSTAVGHPLDTGVLQTEVLLFRPEPKQVPETPNISSPLPEATSTSIQTASLAADSSSNHELSSGSDSDRLMSPFDVVMKQYVYRKLVENALGRIISGDASPDRDVEASIPTAGSARATECSPGSDYQVVAYTFGDYFARCIQQNGDPDFRVRATEIADQYASVMKKICGAMTVFEGCVALICLSLEHFVDPRVFRASCQLACTLFEAMDELILSTPPAKMPTLDIVNELSREHWLPGMTRLLHTFLSNDCCWSASVTRCGQQAHRSKPRTVNRYFLHWVRLLLQQSATQEAFLMVCSSTDSLRLGTINSSSNSSQSAAYTCTVNKFRLFRLLLSTGVDRSALPADFRGRIADCCRAFAQTPRHSESVAVTNTLQRLTKECLQLLARQHNRGSQDKSPATTKWGTTGTPMPGTKLNSPVYAHCPLFRKHPLTPEAEDQLSNQLRRYHDTRPRPPALYRHNFERCDVIDMKAMSFTKGNIQFFGVIEARESPQSDASFHDRLAQHTRPFVFDMTTDASVQPARQASVTSVQSAFSVFRGTVEQRDATVKSAQSGVTPHTSNRLPDIAFQSASRRRKSRDASVTPAAADSRASFLRMPPMPVEITDRLPALPVHASSTGTPTEATVTRHPTKTELVRKPSTAQVAREISRPTQTRRAPPQTALAERQPGSPDKDACCVQ